MVLDELRYRGWRDVVDEGEGWKKENSCGRVSWRVGI